MMRLLLCLVVFAPLTSARKLERQEPQLDLCKGEATGDTRFDCERFNATTCPKRYTPVYGGESFQCNVSGPDCLAVGPRCEAPAGPQPVGFFWSDSADFNPVSPEDEYTEIQGETRALTGGTSRYFAVRYHGGFTNEVRDGWQKNSPGSISYKALWRSTSDIGTGYWPRLVNGACGGSHITSRSDNGDGTGTVKIGNLWTDVETSSGTSQSFKVKWNTWYTFTWTDVLDSSGNKRMKVEWVDKADVTDRYEFYTRVTDGDRCEFRGEKQAYGYLTPVKFSTQRPVPSGFLWWDSNRADAEPQYTTIQGEPKALQPGTSYFLAVRYYGGFKQEVRDGWQVGSPGSISYKALWRSTSDIGTGYWPRLSNGACGGPHITSRSDNGDGTGKVNIGNLWTDVETSSGTSQSFNIKWNTWYTFTWTDVLDSSGNKRMKVEWVDKADVTDRYEFYTRVADGSTSCEFRGEKQSYGYLAMVDES